MFAWLQALLASNWLAYGDCYECVGVRVYSHLCEQRHIFIRPFLVGRQMNEAACCQNDNSHNFFVNHKPQLTQQQQQQQQ